MHNNIPMELRQLPQWVCAGENKIPLNPRTGQQASVTDPNTWATFEEALQAGSRYVGFVLSTWDPYTIIDLDNKPEKPCTPEQWARHQKILEAFDSYTERSASGTGYHIIVKGQIPSGVHRDNVEVYSNARYMICTGDVVRNSPIKDYQELLDILYGEMRPVESVELDERPGVASDEEIVNLAMAANNGEKFDQLCRGEWEKMGYPSQSEADLALLSIFAFYTEDNEQVRRLFRYSKLGRREKAVKNDRYLNFALGKIRANQPPRVDLEALKNNLPAPNPTPPEIKPVAGPIQGLSLPPGLVGEVAQYIYQSSIRPVPEISLAAAIALVAGVCGRSYNISGSGLNQYLVVLAKTGAGKEGAASGIDNLVAAIRPQVPMVDQFIGPAKFASGQGLVRVLDTAPCFVSVLGEFGLTLQTMSDSRSHPSMQALKQVLLDVYAKSGWNKVIRSTAYSDQEKNTKIVKAPNVTILGESTPETFFDGLDPAHIAEGLIPRFSIIEYTGKRPPRNRNANQPPSPELVNRLSDLVAVSLTTSNNNTCATVQIETGALLLLDNFDTKADGLINNAGNDVEMQLWNRAHLKALKLSALIAVGCQPHAPTVTESIAQWAIDFVERDVQTMAARFKAGDVGQGESKQDNDLRRVVVTYLASRFEAVAKYGVTTPMFKDQTIPYGYLWRRVANLASFKNDRRGASNALRAKLQDLIDAGALIEIPLNQVQERYSTRARLFIRGPSWVD